MFYVIYHWDELYVVAPYKQVIDSLPELLKDDPTNLIPIQEIIRRNPETAGEVAVKKNDFAEKGAKVKEAINKALA